MQETESIARNITDTLGITKSIRHIFIDETESPWNEKALIKRKKDHLDVKVTVWNDNTFMYGRIYRLFLYIYDVLNPDFLYDPQIAPEEDNESRMKDRHNQIWSIYVDSRLESKGIETFFNRAVRKNIFVDAEKELTWEESSKIFSILWEKESYTYPEITDYTYNLLKLLNKETIHEGTFELEMIKCLQNSSVKDHIDKIRSPAMQKIVNELLSYTAYHCKDVFIKPSHFGIIVTYNKMFFTEMIPTAENTLFLTTVNPISHSYDTKILTEDSSIEEAQKFIKETFNKFSMITA